MHTMIYRYHQATNLILRCLTTSIISIRLFSQELHNLDALDSQPEKSWKLEGELSIQYRNAVNMQLWNPPRMQKFSVLFNGHQFRMHTPGDAINELDETIIFDGTNYVLTQRFPVWTKTHTVQPTRTGSGYERIPILNPENLISHTNVIVSKRLSPILPRFGPQLSIWLAFAGASSLQKFSADSNPPLFYTMDPLKLSCGAVRSIRKTEVGSDFLSHYTDFWNREMLHDYPRNIDSLTNFAYRVTAWTHVGAKTFPKSGELKRYVYTKRGEPDYLMTSHASFRVIDIELLKKAESIVQLPLEDHNHVTHFTSDLDASDQNVVQYFPSGGQLLSQSEVNRISRNRQKGLAQ